MSPAFTSATSISIISIIIIIFTCNAIIEPYPSLNGGKWENNSYLSKYSPDPIINYKWNLSFVNRSELQIYNVTGKYAYSDNQGSFSNLESIYLTPNSVNVIIYGPGTITIDFGQENAAWFEIDSNDCNDNGLTMSISEYNKPGNTLNPHYPKTLKPIKYKENNITTYRLETNSELFDGIRYGFIHVSSQTNKPWHIIGLRIVSQIKPINYIGLFESKEYPILNKIWYSAAYCVKMNMLPNAMGSILMDRGDRIAFMGDDHIAFKIAMEAFGEFNYVKKNIIQTQNDTDNILSYPLYWILSIYDYYLQTNDKILLQELEIKIMIYLNNSINIFGTNPSINFYGWDDRIGAGFEGANKSPEAQYSYQMLTIQTIGKAMIFWDKNGLNNINLYNYYNQIRQNFINKIRMTDNYLIKYGLHSSADAINGLWMIQNETKYLFNKWYNDSVNICSWSPFNMYYITKSMGILNKINYLLSSLDLCWGNQIRLGATTFWEEFSPEWIDFLSPNDPIPNAFGMTSECHPWSSGSLSIINQFIVGFKIIKPGFHIQIKPVLLIFRAKIPIFVSHAGSISNAIIIDFDALNGKYIINIPVPMEINLYLPITTSLINITNPAFYLNNKQWEDEIKLIIDTESQRYWILIHLNKNQLLLNKNNYLQLIATRQNYKDIDIKLSQDIPNVFPPPYYPCLIINKDFETKGNWINKYGNEGYILFGYQSGSKDLENLPKWITSINPVGASTRNNFITQTSDIRALQDPDNNNNNNNNNTNERALGAIYSNHTANQPPSFALNITININNLNNSFYYMSLYLCDWDNQNRKQSMHVFDANILNLITPIIYDENYVNGLWITLKLDRSVRIRINLVRGNTNILSGLFFDIKPPVIA